jgi:hypothetical protein
MHITFFIKKIEVWSRNNKRVETQGPRKRKTQKLWRHNPATKAQKGGDGHEVRSSPQTRVLMLSGFEGVFFLFLCLFVSSLLKKRTVFSFL